MKPILKNISIIILFFLLMGFCNCSVEKRHYRRGYSVSWFTKKQNRSNEIKTIEVTTVNIPAILASVSNEPAIKKKETSEIKQPATIGKIKHRAKHKLNLNFALPILFPLEQKHIAVPDEQWKKTPATTIISVISIIASIILFGCSVATLGYYLAGSAFVAGAIGLVQTILNRNKYQGIGYAILGTIYGILIIAMLL